MIGTLYAFCFHSEGRQSATRFLSNAATSGLLQPEDTHYPQVFLRERQRSMPAEPFFSSGVNGSSDDVNVVRS